MRVDDPANYSDDFFGHGPSWNFGVEAWCNMEGQYVHIVSDLTHLVGSYEMTICSLGIMGSEYYREGQLPELIEVT